MNEKDFKILLEIEKQRNLTASAEALHMSQPALSYRIQKIEQKLNSKLFIRGRTGIHPTVEGTIAIHEAKKILEQISSLKLKINQIHSKISGTLKIGVASTFGQYIMPSLLDKFIKAFPHVKTEIITGLSQDLLKLLNDNSIHIAILRGVDWKEYNLPISHEYIYLVSKSPIPFSDLSTHPYIQYKMDTYLLNIKNNWWKQWYSQPPNVLMTVDNLETAKEMTRLGIGYTVLPEVSLLQESELIKCPLETPLGDKIIRYTTLHCKHSMCEYPTVNAFIDFIKRYKDEHL